ncbi:hypothetical protein ACFWIO_19185 [Streptomyces diastatochromogenes]|uniref:hypothetical protein n=1 Tax=Streptomyces diastatochromogenes TaxID=42236 RepID=UPI00364B68E2
MNRLPLWIADWIALWRDLPRAPRQVLLNRAHMPGSTVALLVVLLVDALCSDPAATIAVYVAAVLFGPSSLVATAGSVTHMLWDRRLVWGDLECEFCSDGPDEGEDDDPEPEDPDGGDDLIREITKYLRTSATSTV